MSDGRLRRPGVPVVGRVAAAILVLLFGLPVLALLGPRRLAAVTAPLPATIPSAAVGAVPYIQSGEARNHALMRCGSGWTRLD